MHRRAWFSIAHSPCARQGSKGKTNFLVLVGELGQTTRPWPGMVRCLPQDKKDQRINKELINDRSGLLRKAPTPYPRLSVGVAHSAAAVTFQWNRATYPRSTCAAGMRDGHGWLYVAASNDVEVE